MNQEVVFKPSQLAELKTYVGVVGLFIGVWWVKQTHPEWVPEHLQYILLLPLFIGLHRYFKLITVTYTLTDDLLLLEQGILTKSVDELKLFRVVDTKLVFPAETRFFGLGNVVVMSRDQSDPELQIRGIRDPRTVQRLISERVDRARKGQNVRALEVIDGQ